MDFEFHHLSSLKENSTRESMFKYQSPNKEKRLSNKKTIRTSITFKLDKEIENLKSQRIIDPTPYRVLDAPKLRDDFYLNLLDWSSAGPLSIIIGDYVYSYNEHSQSVSKFCENLNT